jgi:hypothetical protein
VRYALTGNPVQAGEAQVPEYFRRATAGPMWDLIDNDEKKQKE